MADQTASRPRYVVGAHVRVPSGLCGSVQSVLRYPRVTAYGVLYDDCEQRYDAPARLSDVYIENELEEVREPKPRRDRDYDIPHEFVPFSGEPAYCEVCSHRLDTRYHRF